MTLIKNNACEYLDRLDCNVLFEREHWEGCLSEVSRFEPLGYELYDSWCQECKNETMSCMEFYDNYYVNLMALDYYKFKHIFTKDNLIDGVLNMALNKVKADNDFYGRIYQLYDQLNLDFADYLKEVVVIPNSNLNILDTYLVFDAWKF